MVARLMKWVLMVGVVVGMHVQAAELSIESRIIDTSRGAWPHVVHCPNSDDFVIADGGGKYEQSMQTINAQDVSSHGRIQEADLVAFSADGTVQAICFRDRRFRFPDKHKGETDCTPCRKPVLKIYRGTADIYVDVQELYEDGDVALEDRPSFMSLAVHPRKKKLVFGCRLGLCFVDWQDSEHVLRNELKTTMRTKHVSSLAYNHAGTHLACVVNGAVIIRDYSGDDITKYRLGDSKHNKSLAYAAGDQYLVILHQDSLRSWDVNAKEWLAEYQLFAQGTVKPVTMVCHPHVLQVAVACDDKTVRIVDIQTGHELACIATDNIIGGLAYNDDGSYLIGRELVAEQDACAQVFKWILGSSSSID